MADLSNETYKQFFYGVLVILVLVIIGFISAIITNKEKAYELLVLCESKLKQLTESFDDELDKQPMVFPVNIKTAPGNCKPYSGCFFPSTQSNPIDLNTGKRETAKDVDKRWCSVSWRDCNAYQVCEDGKCVPK